MSRVWLASYPKSGNTWFRLLIAALSAGDRPLDINDLPEPSRMICGRQVFDETTLIDTALLTHEEGDVLRSRFYTASMAEIDRTTPPASPRFYKVHDAYTYTRDGEPLLGRDTADGAILIVRDPRDVAVSLAAHLHRDIDWTIDFMARDQAALGGKDDDRDPNLRQRLLTWGAHVASWIDQPDVSVHLVTYEALQADPAGVFFEAMRFAGRALTREDARRAAELVRFERLQAQERASRFEEHPGPGPFFRQGRAGRWRETLSAEQARRIEASHHVMMARLGYGCSCAETQTLCK